MPHLVKTLANPLLPHETKDILLLNALAMLDLYVFRDMGFTHIQGYTAKNKGKAKNLNGISPCVAGFVN